MLIPVKTDWRCVGCGADVPGQVKTCACTSNLVFDPADRSKVQQRVKIPVYKALVCGGRNFSDRKLLFSSLDKLDVGHVVEGGADGADTLAREWARARCRPFTEYTANWAEHGKGAGPRRNADMLEEEPNAIVAFPGGRGTAHMVALAAGRGFLIVKIDQHDEHKM